MDYFASLMDLKVSQALKRNVLSPIRSPENICKASARHRFLATIFDPNDTEERRQYSAIFRQLDQEPVSAVPRSSPVIIKSKGLLINDLRSLNYKPAHSSIPQRYAHCVSKSESVQHHCLAIVAQLSCVSRNLIWPETFGQCLLHLRPEHYELHGHRDNLRWMTSRKLSSSGKETTPIKELTAISLVLYSALCTKFKIVLSASMFSTWARKISE